MMPKVEKIYQINKNNTQSYYRNSIIYNKNICKYKIEPILKDNL